jgi:signal transduction histidine kinase
MIGTIAIMAALTVVFLWRDYLGRELERENRNLSLLYAQRGESIIRMLSVPLIMGWSTEGPTSLELADFLGRLPRFDDLVLLLAATTDAEGRPLASAAGEAGLEADPADFSAPDDLDLFRSPNLDPHLRVGQLRDGRQVMWIYRPMWLSFRRVDDLSYDPAEPPSRHAPFPPPDDQLDRKKGFYCWIGYDMAPFNEAARAKDLKLNAALALLGVLLAGATALTIRFHRHAQMAVVGEGAAYLAHDIGNYAGAIAFSAHNIRLALDRPPAELDAEASAADLQKRRAMILNSTARLSYISRNINNLKQNITDFIAKSYQNLNKTKIDLKIIMEEVANNFPALDENGLTLCLPDGPVEIFADENAMYRLAENLLANAEKAAAAGASRPEVAVSLADLGEEVELIVGDNGPGFAPEMLARPLRPGWSSKRKGQGAGLGLWLTLKAVQAHGGRLKLANRPGGGGALVSALWPKNGARPRT